MSSTQRYQGPGQPSLTQGGGWLGRLSGLLGFGTAPRYVDGAVISTPNLLASPAPVYRQAPKPATPSDGTPTVDAIRCSDAAVLTAAPSSGACDPFAQGPIAIFVPRQG